MRFDPYRKLLLLLPVLGSLSLLPYRHHFAWTSLVNLCRDISLHWWVYLPPLLVAFAVVRFAWGLRRSQRRLNALRYLEGVDLSWALPPNSGREGDVRVFDSALPVAFTAGLRHPRIYLSKGLIETLSPRELKATLSHELGHAQRRDPFWSLLTGAAKDLLFPVPIAHWLYHRYRLDAEYDCERASKAESVEADKVDDEFYRSD